MNHAIHFCPATPQIPGSGRWSSLLTALMALLFCLRNPLFHAMALGLMPPCLR